MIEKHIGLGLHDVRIFTDGLIHSPDPEPNFYLHLDCKGKEWDLEYKKFVYKIGQVYLRPEVQYLLEENKLHFAVLDLVYNFIKTKGEIMTLGPIGEEIKQKSIMKAFFEVSLLYPEKHFSYVFCRKVHLKFLSKYYKEELKKMTTSEKIEYYWWVLFNGLHIKDMNVNSERDRACLYNDYKYEAN